MNVNNDYIIRRMPWHSNHTESKHLGRALIAKPHVFEGVVNKVFTAYNYSENPTMDLLVGSGKEVEIGNVEWTWQLRGRSTKPVIVQDTVKTGTPGLGIQPFDLTFAEMQWKPGDVIQPGNELFQCRVQRDLGPAGGGRHKYELILMTKDTAKYLPVKYTAPGTKWGKSHSAYEEGSEQSGSVSYALPFELKDRMFRLRKSYTVTGDATTDVLEMSIPDGTGKRHNMWIKYAEAEFWRQWYKEIERSYWMSRSSDVVTGSTGRALKNGAGMFEKLESSNQHYYSVLSPRLIEDFLMGIFYNRVAPGPRREIVAFTGEYGMIQFNRVVQDALAKKGFINAVDFATQSDASPYHSNARSYGYQFTQYKMSNGISLRLVHNPLYDDTDLFWDIDPLTGYPYQSQRFTFMDFSGEGADSNVRIVKKKGGYSLAYVQGLVGPYGPVVNGASAHAGDYYEMTVKTQTGIHVNDLSKCGELIPIGLKAGL